MRLKLPGPGLPGDPNPMRSHTVQLGSRQDRFGVQEVRSKVERGRVVQPVVGLSRALRPSTPDRFPLAGASLVVLRGHAGSPPRLLPQSASSLPSPYPKDRTEDSCPRASTPRPIGLHILVRPRGPRGVTCSMHQPGHPSFRRIQVLEVNPHAPIKALALRL